MRNTIIVVVILLAAVVLIGLSFGFRVCTSVALLDFSVSEDGSELQFRAGVTTSMGYIRAYHDTGGENSHNLKFYFTFGGLNSKFGAKTEFTLPLSPEDTEIYFYQGNAYQLVLTKNPLTGIWERP